MSLKQLAVRTKKSISGLYSRHEQQATPPPETPKKTPTPNKAEWPSPNLEEFGLSPSSSKTDSPSKRDRLIRSLRKMGSNFEIPKRKPSEESVPHVAQTPPPKPRPSLALNFEVSPPGQPMFDTRRKSSSPETDIHHSSPIDVPQSTQNPPPSTPSSFQVGTVPISPAPLSKTSVRKSFLSRPLKVRDMPKGDVPAADPNPTPMPGTNLPIEDIQTPEIVVSAPSAPSMVSDSYFAVAGPKKNQLPAAEENGDASLPLETSKHIDTASSIYSRPDTLPGELLLGNAKAPTIRDDDSDACDLDSEARRSLERKNDFVNVYLALSEADGTDNRSNGLDRRHSKWGRHTGLYDGTGYAGSEVEDDRVNLKTPSRGSTRDKSEDTVQSTVPTTPLSSCSSVHEKEALQDIIGAYALYDDDHHGQTTGEDAGDTDDSHSVKASDVHGAPSAQVLKEVALAERIMDVSLGG